MVIKTSIIFLIKKSLIYKWCNFKSVCIKERELEATNKEGASFPATCFWSENRFSFKINSSILCVLNILFHWHINFLEDHQTNQLLLFFPINKTIYGNNIYTTVSCSRGQMTILNLIININKIWSVRKYQ